MTSHLHLCESTARIHGHMPCPFCDDLIACVTYQSPPHVNGQPVHLAAIPHLIDLLCDQHMAVHVEEMTTL